MRGRLLVALALAALVPASPAAATGDPVMPLGQVQRGMRCTGYSVFRGTTIEPFRVDVIDVVSGNYTGDADTRILVRVSGPNIDPSGVAAGFSGSPVYCPAPDGTPEVIGALSETVGEYGDHTALATPIEQILAVPVDAPAGTPARRRAAPPGPARPLAAPLSVSGLGPAVFTPLARAAARHGVAIVHVPLAPPQAAAPAPLRPGSAVAVSYSSGALDIGAVGTVTYVDGADVWAFGHPLDGAGARQLFLQDAYVADIIDNPVDTPDSIGSYKLAAPLHDLGTLTDDGLNGIAGRVGAAPPHFPVRVRATDEDRSQDAILGMEVADENGIGNPTGISPASIAVPLAVAQDATEALGAMPLQVAGTLCFKVTVTEARRPLRFCNRYVSDGTVPSADGTVENLVATSAATDVVQALTVLDGYAGRPLHVTGMTARLRETRGQRQAYLRRLRLPRRVRAGHRVPATLRVRLVRGGLRTLHGRFHVPRSLRPGRHRLRVRGAGPDGASDLFDLLTLDLGGGGGSGSEGPHTVSALAAAFHAVHRYDGLRLRGSHAHVFRDPQLRIGGHASATVRVTG